MPMIYKKFASLALAVVAPLALSGCLLLPGDFTSDMTIKKSGEFSFSYKGQIQLVGLATLLNNKLDGEANSATEFTATCFVDPNEEEDKKTKLDAEKKTKRLAAATARKAKADAAKEVGLKDIKVEGNSTAAGASAQADSDEPEVETDQSKTDTTTSDDSEGVATESAADAAAEGAEAAAAVAVEENSDLEERDCTKEEIAEQKAEWDIDQGAKIKREAEQKKMLSMLLGGIDPNDPKTITRFTKEVERLAAWNKVEHLGNGLFKIDYSTSGRLADDFAFPVIPRYSIGQPMIHITRWDNGRVRIEAPSFHNDPDVSMMAMMGGGGMLGAMGGGAAKTPEPVEVKGTFTIRTDASIIANNTDEGPVEEAGMQILKWDIGPATYGAPMALLKMIK
jgi:hypothetical protein